MNKSLLQCQPGLFFVLVLLGLFGLANAAEPDAALRAKLKELLPERTPDAISETPMAGVYEVTYGSDILYFSENGRFLLKGELIDLQERVNLTEQSRGDIRQQLAAGINADDAVVFGPDDAEHKISVFTDVDCHYCQKLHQQIDEYIDQGFQVRYLLWPRGGERSPAYDKSVSVYCADDQQAALTRAKRGKAMPERSCEHPLAKLQAFGQMVGVSGTPAILLEDGSLLPGYRPPKQLAAMLNQRASRN